MTKHKTYFGTTVKVVGAGVVVYLLWNLFRGAHFNNPFNKGWHWGNPFNSGANQGDGDGPSMLPGNSDSTGNNSGSNNSSNPSNGSSNSSNSSNGSGTANTDVPNYGEGSAWDTVIVTPNSQTGTQYFDKNGKYTGYMDENGKCYGTCNVNGIGDETNSRTDFITAVYQDALTAQNKTGIYPETMIAQAILESSDSKGNFGQGDAAKNANNFFGIHADSSWTGDTYASTDDGGQPTMFRSYPTVGDSIRDYYQFLESNSRYTDAGVFSATNPQDQIDALASAGYASSPSYASNLKSLLPWIMAAEGQIKTVPGSPATAADTAVNTDRETNASANYGPGAKYVDKVSMYYLDHKKGMNTGIGLVILFGVSYVATDGFTKNPLKRIFK